MNIRRLEYFLSVVDTGTITHAAAQMHIAQPAMSRQIKTLERELKLSLFEPRGNRLVLTSAGRQFAVMAREVIAKVESTQRAAASLQTGEVESLTIATTVSSARGFIAEFISTTSRRDPALIVRTSDHYALDQALETGADFIISPTIQTPALHTMRLADLQIRAYFPPDHAVIAQGVTSVDLGALCDFDLIIPSASSVSRRQFDAAILAQGLRPRIVAESDDGASAIGLAASGHGVAIGTEPTPDFAASVPITVSGSSLTMPLVAAWRPEHFAAQAIADITLRMRVHLSEHNPHPTPPIMPPGHAEPA